MQTVADRSLQ